jgi:alanyl-tRNA synthetase
MPDGVRVMDADGVREAFLDFQRARGHVVVPRAPLVLWGDPSTLFTGSGMQALLPYLLGAEHPAGRRLADSQPCLRAQDIDDIGDSRHTTFFEMLGNWSLGDYFKAEQLPAVWEFFTGAVGLDPGRIYVSCFAGDPEHGIPRDDESARIWRELFTGAGLDADEADLSAEGRAGQVGSGGARIVYYRDENWWSRGDSIDAMPIGDPGGPDSEVFYLYPDVAHDPAFGARCHPNCDCGRYLEIGNSVFMEYRKTLDGLAPLPRRNVDFGGGLERIAAAAIDSPDVYRISLLRPIVDRLAELAGTSYEQSTYELRVVADHLRGAAFLVADGVRPSNKEQGYLLRRLIRRAVRVAHSIGLTDDFLAEAVPTVTGLYRDSYPEVAANAEATVTVLAAEEQRFRRTLARGLRQLESYQVLTGDDLFTLYDTAGFPVELSTEEARARGIELSPDWRAEFDARMAEQRARSQAARKR